MVVLVAVVFVVLTVSAPVEESAIFYGMHQEYDMVDTLVK